MIGRGLNTFEELNKAGYFYDPTWHADHSNLTHIITSSVKKSPLIKIIPKVDILLGLSGCFAPIHEGHIHMIKLARNHYVRLGKTVAAIIYPAHDSYVSSKKNGSIKDMNISKRIMLIQKEIEQYDWMYVDDYPALELDAEINFPFIVDRMKVISQYTDSKPVFIFGSDNAGFAEAFYDDIPVIIVDRSNNTFNYNNLDPLHINYTRISDNEFAHLSSSLVRDSSLHTAR